MSLSEILTSTGIDYAYFLLEKRIDHIEWAAVDGRLTLRSVVVAVYTTDLKKNVLRSAYRARSRVTKQRLFPPALDMFVFINEMECVYCAVRTESLNIIQINLLNPTGHVMYQQFNIQQLYDLPTLYLCILYLSENKQRLVPLTA